MAISERLQAALEQHTKETTDQDLDTLRQRSPEDWSRFGLERFLAAQEGTPRAVESRGVLRFHGTSVHGHRAELATVGLVAAAWQKAVTAVGASIEGITSTRGRLPKSIEMRTTVMLDAAPAPGSVVFNLTPRSPALEEAEPTGMPALGKFLSTRPLVDQASEGLLLLLSQLGKDSPELGETMTSELRARGSRVITSVAQLAQTIAKSSIALDSSWTEPEHETYRTRFTPEQARWLTNLIARRDLAKEKETIVGELVTISNRKEWQLKVDDGDIVSLNALDVPEDTVKRFNVYDYVRAEVEATHHLHGNGTTTTSYKLLGVSAITDTH